MIGQEEYDLLTDPARELTRRIAAAIRTESLSRPIMISLDTGEIIGERAWGWIRQVMLKSGPRAIWVVGARFVSEAEAGIDSPVAKFVRQIGDRNLVLMSPSRFDDAMIEGYLKNRTPDRIYDDADIDRVARFTKGLPLAVSLAANLLEQNLPLDIVCEQSDTTATGSVVSQLARRYLIHTENHIYDADDPRHMDLERILGLALVYGDLHNDPELLSALWGGVLDPIVALQDLARRHDFVLALSRRLHDDVRDTFRLDLLDPYRRRKIRVANQRALALFKNRVDGLSTPDLDAQLDNSSFMPAFLSKLWHTFWEDNQAGLDMLVSILPVLLVTQKTAADAAASIAYAFRDALDPQQRRVIDSLVDLGHASFLDEWLARRRKLAAGAQLPSGSRASIPRAKRKMSDRDLPQNGAAGRSCELGIPGDRAAVIALLRGQRHLEDGRVNDAIDALQEAVRDTNSRRIRREAGKIAKSFTSKLLYAGPRGTAIASQPGLVAARVAAEMLEDDTFAWRNYGVALDELERETEALAMYDRALEVDPQNAWAICSKGNTLFQLAGPEVALREYERAAVIDPKIVSVHVGMGNALLKMDRLSDALAAYDRGIECRSDYFGAHNGRGIVLRRLGRLGEASAAYDRALEISPNDVEVLNNRGIALIALGDYDRALADYDRAIRLSPSDSGIYENRGVALALSGQLDDALASLQTADRLAPTGAGEALAWLGAIHWHRREPDLAQACFDAVLGHVQGNTEFATRRIEAIAQCGLGHAERAEEALRDAQPLRLPGDVAGREVEGLSRLLLNPPLPGFNRLTDLL